MCNLLVEKINRWGLTAAVAKLDLRTAYSYIPVEVTSRALVELDVEPPVAAAILTERSGQTIAPSPGAHALETVEFLRGTPRGPLILPTSSGPSPRGSCRRSRSAGPRKASCSTCRPTRPSTLRSRWPRPSSGSTTSSPMPRRQRPFNATHPTLRRRCLDLVNSYTIRSCAGTPTPPPRRR